MTGRQRLLWILLGVAIAGYFVTMPYRRALEGVAERRRHEQNMAGSFRALEGMTESEIAGEIEQLEGRGAVGDGRDAARLVRLSALYTRLRRYPEALRALRAATATDPHSLELRLALADVYETTGYYDRALEELARVRTEHGDRPELLLRLGRLHTLVGWHQEATTLLERAVAADPESVEARRALGLSHYNRVNFSAALAALNEAARRAPHDPTLSLGVARVQFDAGQHQACRTTLEQAIARFPDLAGLHLLYGKLRLRGATAADVDAAAAAFRRARESRGTEEERLEAEYQLGLCALQKGDTTGAIAAFERVTARTLELQAVALKLGQLYLKLGRKREGERLVARYEQIMRRGDEEKRLSLRVAMRPADAAAHHALGRFLVTSVGDFRRGITELKRAVELAPDEPRYRTILHDGLRRAGRAAEVE